MIVPAGFVLEYPCSDGKLRAGTTRQFEWIVTVKEGLELVFRDRPDVFVAGDLLWYPVEGEVGIRAAPDAMVVFGRPKGHRLSYIQHREENIPPQVVFDILSPSNTHSEMMAKLEFYDTCEVEEYYQYHPDDKKLWGWCRNRGAFLRIRGIEKGWTSPRLGVRLELDGELVLTGPDGRRFQTYAEIAAERDRERRAAEWAAERLHGRTVEIERLREMLRSRGIDPDAQN